MPGNLLITGPPGCGKTTLVGKFIDDPVFKNRLGGFVTEEVRSKGRRVGFEIVSLPLRQRAPLAEKGKSSPFRVGSYGVDLESFEELGCRALEKAMGMNWIICIDEVGKMELFSNRFRTLFWEALDSTLPVLATIMEKPQAYADAVKGRPDTEVLVLGRDNFKQIRASARRWLVDSATNAKI